MTTGDVPTWLLVLLATSLVLAGCIGPESGSGDGVAGPPSGDEAADAFADIESVNVTTRFHYDRPTGNETVVRHYVVEPEENRIWMMSLAPESRAGNLQVSNGSVLWEYNATRNEVLVRRFEGDDRSLFVDGTRQYIFDSLNETSEDPGSSSAVGVFPLPVVPAGSPVGENLSLANYSMEYGGVESIAGRKAHVVHIEADQARDGLRNQSVWFDTETFFQLRVQTTFRSDGQVTRIVQEVQRAAFGEDFSDDRFVFDPPADGTVRLDGRISVRTYDSRDALSAETRMTLPDPELSGAFAFTEGRHILRQRDGNRTASTSQIYTRRLNSLIVFKTNRTSAFDALTANATVESLSVGDREAYFLERPRILLWRCDGNLYRVAGLFPKERLVRIGESIACD